MSEVRPADPKARKRAVWVLVAVTVLGASVLLMMPRLQTGVEEWLLDADNGLQRARWLIRAMGLTMGLLVLAPAVYCYRFAARIEAAGEFPPPGAKLIREVKILKGDAARGRAWLLRALAIKLAVMALVCAVLVWVFGDLLLR